MLIKVKFRYINEVWSFLNENFTKWAIVFFVSLFLVGYFVSDFKTTMGILGIITLIYIGFVIKTLKIKKKYKFFIKNGTKTSGTIKDIKVKDGHTGLTAGVDNRYEIVYLIVEFKNPYSNKIEQFTTESVNGNPFIYLSSLDVTVYVLPEGRALATDFKRIKKLSDSVKCQNDEKYKKEVEWQEKNRFKYVFYCIVFFCVIALIFTKANFITCFIIILIICVISILFGNKK